jgi:hypothetical protein
VAPIVTATTAGRELREAVNSLVVGDGGTCAADQIRTGDGHSDAGERSLTAVDKKKADVWPLNKNGELLLTVIIESIPGLEKAREIAAEPGVAQVGVGYGTLAGVASSCACRHFHASQTVRRRFLERNPKR